MMIPAQDYRRTKIVTPAKLHQGLDNVVYGLVGKYRVLPDRFRKYRMRAEAILEKSKVMRNVADRRISSRLAELAEKFRRIEKTSDDNSG